MHDCYDRCSLRHVSQVLYHRFSEVEDWFAKCQPTVVRVLPYYLEGRLLLGDQNCHALRAGVQTEIDCSGLVRLMFPVL